MQIRLSFRHKFCKTLQLPSGKWSDYDLFPISDEEVANLTTDITETIPTGVWLTRDEYLLWVALRRKYGVNYLRPKKQVFLSHIDEYYREQDDSNELENLEAKMMFYCDEKIKDAIHLFSARIPEPELDTQKPEKNFRGSLDNTDFDVLY